MKNPFSHGRAKSDNSTDKFKNRSESDKQIEEMEQFLSKIDDNARPVTVRRFPKKLVLILSLCIILALGTTIFFLKGDNDKKSPAKPTTTSSDGTYLSMEQAYADSIGQFLTSGQTILDNLKNNNTKCSGEMNIDLSNINDELKLPNFHYDIDGYFTKDIAIANMDLSILDKPIASKSFYQKTDDNIFNSYYSEYGSKPANMKLFIPEQYKTILNTLSSLYPTINKYYSTFIEDMVNEGSQSVTKNVNYTVGDVPSTSDCYEITLSEAQLSKVGMNLIAKMSEDNKNAEETNVLPLLISEYFNTLTPAQNDGAKESSKPKASENVKDSAPPFFSMKVYCKDKQILGRTITLNTGDTSTTIFMGSVQTENTYAFSFYVESGATAGLKNKDINIDLRTTNSNNLYDGTFTFTFNSLELTGDFNQVKFDLESSTFPVTGSLNAKVSSLDTTVYYPDDINITATENDNKLQLDATINYQPKPEDVDTSLADVSALTNCTSSLNLTLEKNGQGDIPSLKDANAIPSSTWEDYANALSDQPIEKMIDKYANVMQKNDHCTHNKALNVIKGGQLYSFIPNINALLQSYNASSYYAPDEYNLADYANIDFFGNYDLTIDNIISINDQINKLDPKCLEGGKQVPVTPTYKTKADKLSKNIIKLVKDKTGLEFQETEVIKEAYTEITGNVFTGQKTFSMLSLTRLSQKPDPSILHYTQDGVINIVFDAMSGKIQSLHAYKMLTKVKPENISGLACELSGLIDPRKTSTEYARIIYDPRYEGYIKTDTGYSAISYSFSPYDEMESDNLNECGVSISCDFQP